MSHWVLAKVEKDQVWIYPIDPNRSPIGFWKSPTVHYSHQFLIGMGCIVPDADWANFLARDRHLSMLHVSNLPLLVPKIDPIGVVDFDYLIEAKVGQTLDDLGTPFYYPSIQSKGFPLADLPVGYQRWQIKRQSDGPVLDKFLGVSHDSGD